MAKRARDGSLKLSARKKKDPATSRARLRTAIAKINRKRAAMGLEPIK